MASSPRIRVLIADSDNQLSRRLGDYIEERGFAVRIVNNGRDAREVILDWKPRFVLADLILSEGSALTLIDFIRNEDSLRHQFIHVLVMSAHNDEQNVLQTLHRGAKDYIVKPFRPEDLLKRLVFHARGYRQLSDLSYQEANKIGEASLMLHLTDLVLKQAVGRDNLEDTLFNLTRMVNLKVDGVRCSIVHCVSQHLGYVVTSNDSRAASGLNLDLYKYPEILHVMNTRSLVAIENLEQNAEMRHIHQAVKEIAFNSMIVCPLTRHARPFGVLSLRLPLEKGTVSDNEIRFVEIVSHVVSLVLGAQIHNESDDFWIKAATNPPIPLAPRKVKNP